jgi:hypothetical protein
MTISNRTGSIALRERERERERVSTVLYSVVLYYSVVGS